MFRSPLQPTWDLTIHLIGSQHPRHRRLVSDSDTICNSPSLPLANIVCRQSHSFKTCLLGRGLRTRTRNVSVLFLTSVESHTKIHTKQEHVNYYNNSVFHCPPTTQTTQRDLS